MARTRAADDFETIRARIEELRREKMREPVAAKPSGAKNAVRIPGHRGPCACGLSLFPDECDGSCKAL